jgi:hypothetical protein
MSERLTDERVAALLAEHPTDERDGYYLNSHDEVSVGEFRAALLEVQLARQRRCGNCAYYGIHGVDAQCDIDMGVGAPGHITSGPDWFCADFTAKP